MRVKQPGGKILFREVQPYRKSGFWTLLIFQVAVIVFISLFIFILGIWKGMPGKGYFPVSLALVMMVAYLVVYYFLRLETVITDQGVYYRWWPFRKKYSAMLWTEIVQVTIKRYDYENREYWGGKRFGGPHHVNGSKIVKFVLVGFQRNISLGSQRMVDLQKTIETIRPVTVETI